MKHTHLLATLALCALIQAPLCLSSETQQVQQSFLNRYAFNPIRNLGSTISQKTSSAYTSTRDYAASWVPQSVKDRVNTWSTKKKMAVASAILVALAAIYNKDVLMQWVSNILDPQLTAEQLKALNLPTDLKVSSRIAHDKNIFTSLEDAADFERRNLNKYIERLARGIIAEGWHGPNIDEKLALTKKLLNLEAILQSNEPGTKKHFMTSEVIKILKKHIADKYPTQNNNDSLWAF